MRLSPNLAPGENYDVGTVKLVRVFGTGLPRDGTQVDQMFPNDAGEYAMRFPPHWRDDGRAVTILWAVDGEFETFLPPGYYRLGVGVRDGRAQYFTLHVGEDAKSIQLDFDAEGNGTVVVQR